MADAQRRTVPAEAPAVSAESVTVDAELADDAADTMAEDEKHEDAGVTRRRPCVSLWLSRRTLPTRTSRMSGRAARAAQHPDRLLPRRGSARGCRGPRGRRGC